ncbi:putative signal transduction protein with Nacht domain [Rippkaea orientalis PCC 8801]|uniref:Putative signal transduction protein with Nacht domain n=1 Tax=Rippkaea orientalis (strain PCC 8801 / RF-1) TaxID=41431 RepID=B7JX81_RIPO1|nr:NACHT domain-containing protein [Rippkaea orientalis]ACK67069.1 putative signal transduction protein with Nacht domain [Rippkaea orientalis PCC 8801]
MIDWLVIWGVTQAVGFTFKPIIEELAKDAAKDWVKDMFKGCLSNVVKLPQQEPLIKAAGKALKEFLDLFQQQLEDAELDNDQVKKYLKPLKRFIGLNAVKEVLGSPFQTNINTLDTKLLNNLWDTYHLTALPDEFNWQQLSKRYVKKVKAIIQEEKELRDILEAELLKEIADNTNTKIKANYDLIQYQETLRERYKNIPLGGLEYSIQDRKVPLWNVFVPQKIRECQEYLPKVNEIPKELQKKLREYGQLEREYTEEELEKLEKFYLSQPIRPVLEMLDDKKYQFMVILGDPGAGKSTLLKYLAIRWTELPRKALTTQPIPLLIELRDYLQNYQKNECQNFLEFIDKSSGWVGHLNQHSLDETLKRGDGLVMLDGLDDVFDLQQRRMIINQIHDLTQDYPKIKVIVTSRIIGYEPQWLRDANFNHFIIQDFDDNQIEEFSEKWHQLTCDTEEEEKRNKQRLREGINNSAAIQQLSGNPLLLTMMAILNRSQELPRDRGELYNECSRILLYQWDVGRALIEDPRIDHKIFHYQNKQAMCRQIAYFMQLNKDGLAGNIISGEDLEKILTDYLRDKVKNPWEIAKLMINQLRSRNFILCSLGVIGHEGHYGFVHRTFLEYFCASEFVDRFEKRKTLSIDELKNEVFSKHWNDEKWHEVLRLISGMIDPKFTGEIIEFLMNLKPDDATNPVNLFLAADCLSEVRNRQEIKPIDDRLFKEIKALVHGRNIRKAWDHYDYDKAKQFSEILSNSLKAIAIVWKDYLYLKNRAVADEDGYVRRTAIEQAKKDFRNDSKVQDFLKNL